MCPCTSTQWWMWVQRSCIFEYIPSVFWTAVETDIIIIIIQYQWSSKGLLVHGAQKDALEFSTLIIICSYARCEDLLFTYTLDMAFSFRAAGFRFWLLCLLDLTIGCFCPKLYLLVHIKNANFSMTSRLRCGLNYSSHGNHTQGRAKEN